MPFVEVNGVRLHYDEYGRGHEVIISAQSSFSEGSYQEELAKQSDRYKVYTITLRGYAPSSHVLEDLGEQWYPTWADDVNAFAKQKGIGRFIYTGASHGAGVGWYLAFRHPQVLKAFISVVGTPHDRAGGQYSKQRLQTMQGAQQEDFEGPQFFLVPTTDPVRQKRQAIWRQRLKERFATMSKEELKINVPKPFPECKTNEALAEKLSQVRVPTLLLAGCQDDVVSPEMHLLAAKVITGAKAIFYQDHSHTLPFEGKELIVQDILLYLQQLEQMEA